MIKIIDFGCAYKFKPGEVLETKCGTIFYTAPEVLFQSTNKIYD